MLITLDSNVWEKMVCPDDALNTDPKFPIYKELNQFIGKEGLDFVISETVFSLEAIGRKERKKFFSGYTPKIDMADNNEESQQSSISIAIGPNDDLFPDLSAQLLRKANIAFELGIKVLQLPRIAIPSPNVIHSHRYPATLAHIEATFSAAEFIEDQLNCGYSWLTKLFDKHNLPDIFLSVYELPSYEENNVSKAIAEWADGDSIAAHIGYGGRYFCTNDKASNAGSGSVMHPKNIEILHKKFCLNVVSPEDLLDYLSGIGND